jgi:DNA-binding PadR family transcriptional regulator
MERKLLLLGLLRMHDMHGYQLNEVIDQHLGQSIALKKPTAYNLLKQMADDGWIIHEEEQAGNRPPRRVYALTPEGEAAFQRLLRASLADYKPAEFYSDISLAFLDAIPAHEALDLLRQRRAAIEQLLAAVSADDAHHPGSMQLVIEHKALHLQTEIDWLDGVMSRLAEEANKA